MSYFRFGRYDEGAIASLSNQFGSAQPFPHLVLDDVVAGDAAELGATFPTSDWDGWHRFRDEYQVGKLFCQDIALIPDPWAAMLRELCEPVFLDFLQQVTGIEALIPDPYFEGGGLHCSGSGGVLAPHTDFHIYRRLSLYRQINVLVYLNEQWSEDDGGCLELYRAKESKPEATVVPNFGRCVIFRTDDQSVHGFSTPVKAEDRPRRSLALYYYTSTESARYSGDTTTYWRQHGNHRGVGRARLAMYNSLLFGSRGLAYLAHRANPNVGARRPT